MKRKGDNKPRNVSTNKTKPPPPSTVIFVPSSDGGTLLKMLENLESELWKNKDVSWSVKLVEQSGKQLRNKFNTRIPIVSGCPLGRDCLVCDGDAIKCTTRNVVYMAECEDCSESGTVDGLVQRTPLSDSWYVGETSRPLRMRAREHHNKLRECSTDSFMFTHWMKCHGLDMIPPKYTFRIMGTYTDCLSRQIAEAIQIEDKGILNKHSEYGVNHLPRLEAAESEQDRNKLLEKETREKANLMSDLNCFRNVVLGVCNKVNELLSIGCDSCILNKIGSNGCTSCRLKRKKTADPAPENETGMDQAQAKRKRRRKEMLASTPIWDHRGTVSDESATESQDTNSWVLDFSGGSFCQESYLTPRRGDGSKNKTCGTELVSAGLTPALNKLLIHPFNEDEFESTRKLLQETINLTRTAILNGIINEDIDLEEFTIRLSENSLYRSFNVIDPLQDLLDNLNLNEWDVDDFETFEILHRPKTGSRKGVLDNMNFEKINMDPYLGGITSGISTRPRREVPDVIAGNEMVSICPTLITGCNNEILHKSNNGQTDR